MRKKIYRRIDGRKRIRAATRAILKGSRSRVHYIGPNWKSGKYVRDIPDPEAMDDL